MVPENASVNLNSTTKASAAQASLRTRNSVNAPIAACITRANAVSVRVAASARADCSGAVAANGLTVPIGTVAAVPTEPHIHAAEPLRLVASNAASLHSA